MDAAALLLLVAGLGIDFGWQPMPDGSPRYEYLVQVEPEMLESLAEGHTLPIAGDVPRDVHPIARVRVVVGHGDLPRRRLVTQRKPVDGAASSDGSAVVLTQFTEAIGTPRYATPPPAGSDPYTQAPSVGAAASGASAWNGAVAATGGDLDAAWNGGAAADLVENSADRMREGFQQATAPLQDGIDHVGEQLRSATNDLGGRTEQLLDELGLPPRQNGGQSVAAAPFSLGGAPSAGGTWNPGGEEATAAPMWNGGAGSAPVAAAPVTPTESGPGSNWNSGTGFPDVAGSGQGGVAPDPGFGVGGNYAGGPVAPPLVTAGSGRGATVADPWDNSTDPRFRTAPPGAAGGDAAAGGFGAVAPGARLPGFVNASNPAGSAGGPVLGDPSGAGTPHVGRPSIDAGMLALPGDRPLEAVAESPFALGPGTSLPGTGAAGSGSGAFVPATAGPPNPAATGSNGAGPLASHGWATDSASTTTAATAADNAAAASASEQNKLLVLVAWVLLFASVAGNLYLFWSYLDVRTKYRALVRKTARAVGSRFSPA